MADLWTSEGKSIKAGGEREPDVIEKIAIRKQEELEERREKLRAENAAELAAAREEAKDKARFDRMVKDGWDINSPYGRAVATGGLYQTKHGSHLW